jgi:hypothetical protein
MGNWNPRCFVFASVIPFFSFTTRHGFLVFSSFTTFLILSVLCHSFVFCVTWFSFLCFFLCRAFILSQFFFFAFSLPAFLRALFFAAFFLRRSTLALVYFVKDDLWGRGG